MTFLFYAYKTGETCKAPAYKIQIFFSYLTQTLSSLTKSYNRLSSKHAVLLCNRPSVSIGTKRLACLNSLRGVQLGTLIQHAVARSWVQARSCLARCAQFFLHPPFPPLGGVYFAPSPPPCGEVRVKVSLLFRLVICTFSDDLSVFPRFCSVKIRFSS